MASIELTVAYPGREGAHSAAACDRLFPAARLVPAADVLRRRRRRRLGPRSVRRAPDRELARRAGRRDARPALRVTALDRGGGDPAREPLPRRPRRRGALGRARDPFAPGRPRPVPQARRVTSRMRSRWPRRRRAMRPRSSRSSPIPPSSRSRAIGRPGSTGSRSSTGTSATTPRPTRGSSPSPRTRGSTGATASGGRRSRSRPITARGRSSTRSSRSPATRIDLNLLVSRPIPSRPFSYRFDAVLSGHPLDPEISVDAEGDARPDGRAPRVRLVPRRPRRPHRSTAPSDRVELRQAAACSNCSSDGRYWRQLSGTRCAARRMKSTGAGARGGRGSDIDTSSSRRSPLRRLHGAHAVTTFSQTESPPFERGITWSSVSRPPRGAAVDAFPAVAGEEGATRDPPLHGAGNADVLEQADHVRPEERARRPTAAAARGARRPRPCPSTRGRARAGRSTR